MHNHRLPLQIWLCLFATEVVEIYVAAVQNISFDALMSFMRENTFTPLPLPAGRSKLQLQIYSRFRLCELSFKSRETSE